MLWRSWYGIACVRQPSISREEGMGMLIYVQWVAYCHNGIWQGSVLSSVEC